MVDETLAAIRDIELMKLYMLSSADGITKRAKQVRSELERRGYLFDAKRREFITCAEWNKRYFDAPIDCAEHAKQLIRR